MPKKTKREKRLAELRRTAYSRPAVHQTTTRPSAADHPGHGQFRYSAATPPANQRHSATENEFKEIKRDIIKTVLITVSILIIELLLSRYLT